MRTSGGRFIGELPYSVEPDPAREYSVLLIVAGRMQGESLRYQLVSRGFEVDLARSVSAGPGAAGQWRPMTRLVLDWQTLEVEYPGPSGWRSGSGWRGEVAGWSARSVGLVALIDSEQSAPPEIEQAGAIRISRGAASEPHALAAAVERAMERQAAAPPPCCRGTCRKAGGKERLPRLPTPAGVIEHFLFGESEAIRRVFEQVRLVARRDTTVLITGETGTGKERVSRAIHRLSSRA